MLDLYPAEVFPRRTGGKLEPVRHHLPIFADSWVVRHPLFDSTIFAQQLKFCPNVRILESLRCDAEVDWNTISLQHYICNVEIDQPYVTRFLCIADSNHMDWNLAGSESASHLLGSHDATAISTVAQQHHRSYCFPSRIVEGISHRIADTAHTSAQFDLAGIELRLLRQYAGALLNLREIGDSPDSIGAGDDSHICILAKPFHKIANSAGQESTSDFKPSRLLAHLDTCDRGDRCGYRWIGPAILDSHREGIIDHHQNRGRFSLYSLASQRRLEQDQYQYQECEEAK